MIYLLDTNVWIHLVRQSSPPLDAKFRNLAPSADICTCSVVLAELWYGCARSAKPAANRIALQALVAPFRCLPFDEMAADQFALIRRNLKVAGTVIGPYDLQIAAIALTNNCVLVTNNTKEFGRVSGLQLEDWQTPPGP